MYKATIESYLGKFVKGLKSEQLEASVLSGELSFSNLEIEPDAAFEWFSALLPYTAEVESLKCDKASIKIPWTALRTRPLTVTINEATLTLKVHDLRDAEWAAKVAEDQRYKVAESREFPEWLFVKNLSRQPSKTRQSVGGALEPTQSNISSGPAASKRGSPAQSVSFAADQRNEKSDQKGDKADEPEGALPSALRKTESTRGDEVDKQPSDPKSSSSEPSSLPETQRKRSVSIGVGNLGPTDGKGDRSSPGDRSNSGDRSSPGSIVDGATPVPASTSSVSADQCEYKMFLDETRMEKELSALRVSWGDYVSLGMTVSINLLKVVIHGRNDSTLTLLGKHFHMYPLPGRIFTEKSCPSGEASARSDAQSRSSVNHSSDSLGETKHTTDVPNTQIHGVSTNASGVSTNAPGAPIGSGVPDTGATSSLPPASELSKAINSTSPLETDRFADFERRLMEGDSSVLLKAESVKDTFHFDDMAGVVYSGRVNDIESLTATFSMAGDKEPVEVLTKGALKLVTMSQRKFLVLFNKQSVSPNNHYGKTWTRIAHAGLKFKDLSHFGAFYAVICDLTCAQYVPVEALAGTAVDGHYSFDSDLIARFREAVKAHHAKLAESSPKEIHQLDRKFSRSFLIPLNSSEHGEEDGVLRHTRVKNAALARSEKGRKSGSAAAGAAAAVAGTAAAVGNTIGAGINAVGSGITAVGSGITTGITTGVSGIASGVSGIASGVSGLVPFKKPTFKFMGKYSTSMAKVLKKRMRPGIPMFLSSLVTEITRTNARGMTLAASGTSADAARAAAAAAVARAQCHVADSIDEESCPTEHNESQSRQDSLSNKFFPKKGDKQKSTADKKSGDGNKSVDDPSRPTSQDRSVSSEHPPTPSGGFLEGFKNVFVPKAFRKSSAASTATGGTSDTPGVSGVTIQSGNSAGGASTGSRGSRLGRFFGINSSDKSGDQAKAEALDSACDDKLERTDVAAKKDGPDRISSPKVGFEGSHAECTGPGSPGQQQDEESPLRKLAQFKSFVMPSPSSSGEASSEEQVSEEGKAKMSSKHKSGHHGSGSESPTTSLYSATDALSLKDDESTEEEQKQDKAELDELGSRVLEEEQGLEGQSASAAPSALSETRAEQFELATEAAAAALSDLSLDQIIEELLFSCHSVMGVKQLSLEIGETHRVEIKNLDMRSDSEYIFPGAESTIEALFSSRPNRFVQGAALLTRSVLCPLDPVSAHSFLVVEKIKVHDLVAGHVSAIGGHSSQYPMGIALRWRARLHAPAILGRPMEGCVHGVVATSENMSFLSSMSTALFEACGDMAGDLSPADPHPALAQVAAMSMKIFIRDVHLRTAFDTDVLVPSVDYTKNLTTDDKKKTKELFERLPAFDFILKHKTRPPRFSKSHSPVHDASPTAASEFSVRLDHNSDCSRGPCFCGQHDASSSSDGTPKQPPIAENHSSSSEEITVLKKKLELVGGLGFLSSPEFSREASRRIASSDASVASRGVSTKD